MTALASVEGLLPGLLARERRAVARALTWVENETPEGAALLDQVFPRLGRAYRIGLTGPPGAGKSTLTAAFAAHLRSLGKSVGIVAVDPSSPFTGGAVLGDRIRMGHVATDNDVFIRSMASRGALGGLARTTQQACDILDAAGFDVVLIETVGVGQAEVDVASAADTTMVVVSPESGDSVQTLKAGLMEVADLFVVNKSDRQGADNMVRALRGMISLAGLDATEVAEGRIWQPKVVRTIATSSEGVEDLATAAFDHHGHLDQRGIRAAKQRQRTERHLRALVRSHIEASFWARIGGESVLESACTAILAGEATPQQALRTLLAKASRSTDGEHSTGEHSST